MTAGGTTIEQLIMLWGAIREAPVTAVGITVATATVVTIYTACNPHCLYISLLYGINTSVTTLCNPHCSH